MTEDERMTIEVAAAGEGAMQLRQFWTDSIEHAKAHGHSGEDVIVQMLAVATKAAETVLGRDLAVRLYTDQAALLMELDAQDARIIEAGKNAPRH